ncbi:MAG: hypothetical protein U9Q58_08505 [Pseudomonadota bacterium]|nr:hypothetical protein [Pseudomonadota bacterium]
MNDVDHSHVVLFVDDEKPILKSLARLFINELFRVITCSNPLEALQLLEKQSEFTGFQQV